MSAPDAILLAGPTASGKSRLALDLAVKHNGVVVNADSMQVYAELSVLTARPSAEDEAAMPHRLYGHVSAAAPYSVGRWLADVAVVLAEARDNGMTPIVVGGTGLYFRALTLGLATVPPISPAVRDRVRAEARGIDTAALHGRLTVVDREAAETTRPSDRARILRAIEVMEATGQSLTAWWRVGEAPPLVPPAQAERIVLAPPRAILHQRIAERAGHMAHHGGPAEVEALLSLGLDREVPAMKAIGVRELAAHLKGDTSLDEAIAAIKTETRRYAKRQTTWFRGQMADWRWIDDPAALDLSGLLA